MCEPCADEALNDHVSEGGASVFGLGRGNLRARQRNFIFWLRFTTQLLRFQRSSAKFTMRFQSLLGYGLGLAALFHTTFASEYRYLPGFCAGSTRLTRRTVTPR